MSISNRELKVDCSHTLTDMRFSSASQIENWKTKWQRECFEVCLKCCISNRELKAYQYKRNGERTFRWSISNRELKDHYPAQHTGLLHSGISNRELKAATSAYGCSGSRGAASQIENWKEDAVYGQRILLTKGASQIENWKATIQELLQLGYALSISNRELKVKQAMKRSTKTVLICISNRELKVGYSLPFLASLTYLASQIENWKRGRCCKHMMRILSGISNRELKDELYSMFKGNCIVASQIENWKTNPKASGNARFTSGHLK